MSTAITSFKHKVHRANFRTTYKQHDEMVAWARATFGNAGLTWTYYLGVWRFRFKKDYTLFLLRWS